MSKKDINKDIIKDSELLVVRKSNEMIEGRNFNSLIQNQLIDVSIAFAKKNKEGIYIADWCVKDLDAFPGINRHNIYSVLTAMENPNNDINKNYTVLKKDGSYEKFPLIDTFKYDRKGHVSVRFTHGASKYFGNMKDNYTTNLLAITTQFKSMPTYRLYELCSTKAYLLYTKNKDEVRIQYDLYELKSKIDPNPKFAQYEQDLEKKLGRKVTAKEVYEMAPESIELYKVFYDFRRHVLDKTKKEINLYCSIANNNRAFNFDYEVIKKGVGGKVTDVVLIISKDTSVTEDGLDESDDIRTEEGVSIIPTSYSQDEIIAVINIFKKNHPVTVAAAEALLVAAGGDIQRIKQIYYMARATNGIRNIIGWMISGLQEGIEFIPSEPGMSYEETKSYQIFKAQDNIKEYGTEDPEEIDEIIQQRRSDIAEKYNVTDEFEISKLLIKERKEKAAAQKNLKNDKFNRELYKQEEFCFENDNNKELSKEEEESRIKEQIRLLQEELQRVKNK